MVRRRTRRVYSLRRRTYRVVDYTAVYWARDLYEARALDWACMWCWRRQYDRVMVVILDARRRDGPGGCRGAGAVRLIGDIMRLAQVRCRLARATYGHVKAAGGMQCGWTAVRKRSRSKREVHRTRWRGCWRQAQMDGRTNGNGPSGGKAGQGERWGGEEGRGALWEVMDLGRVVKRLNGPPLKQTIFAPSIRLEYSSAQQPEQHTRAQVRGGDFASQPRPSLLPIHLIYFLSLITVPLSPSLSPPFQSCPATFSRRGKSSF